MAEKSETNTNDAQELPELKDIKPIKPTFFGYRPPSWANDFEHVRNNKGKGDPSDSNTWVLYAVDRLLKKFSL